MSDTNIVEEGRIDHRDADQAKPVPPCPVVSTPDGDALVIMVCDPDAPASMRAHWCESMPREESKWWAEEYGLDPETLPADRDVVVCWPDGGNVRPIQRMLVMGDRLWSYSWQRLQENAWDGLDRRQIVSLG